MEKEILDYFDDDMQRLGSAPRDEIHAKGLLHQVSHCWIVTYTGKTPAEDNIRFWGQQRAFTKKDFPGLYDILSMGGHIDAGETPLHAACRESWEELGLTLSPESLACLGSYRDQDVLLPGFTDRETAWVYAVCLPEPAGFHPGEEVERMVWLSYPEICRKELENRFPVTVHTAQGEAVKTLENQWCVHDGEFERMILPWLYKTGIVTG